MSDWIAFQIKGDRGPPLIFLHGIGGAADAWQAQLDHFAGTYRAIAWDMPGYGDSRPLPDFTFARLAGALLRLLDRLQIRSAHLVGHAMGGMIAQELLVRQPERVLSLTLVATSAAFGRPDGQWQQRFVEQRLAPLERGRRLGELAPELVARLVGEAADEAGVARAIETLAAVDETIYRAAISSLPSFDRRAELAAIKVPTLLVAGGLDRVAPPAMMARLAEQISGAHLVVLPSAGHLVPLEQPAAFNRTLQLFLAGLTPAPPA